MTRVFTRLTPDDLLHSTKEIAQGVARAFRRTYPDTQFTVRSVKGGHAIYQSPKGV